jgi:hypothetical protein
MKNIKINPQDKILITFEFKKTLLSFEDYPNDPARGFDIP